MLIFNKVFTRKQLLNIFVLFILIVGIPVGVYLTLQQQNLKSRANVEDQTRIEILGPNISNGVTSSRNIKVKLTYVIPQNGTVTTCKGQAISWGQLDSDLHSAGFPGPYDHTQQEIDAYNRAACPSQVTVTTCKGETKAWSQIDSELQGAGYNGVYNHTQPELDAYNRAACPNGSALPEPVTTCKGDSKSWLQLDSELHKANFPGPYDHTQQELTAYNQAVCPEILNQPNVATCLGNESWNQMDTQLKASKFPGPFSHNQTELDGFNAIMCPSNPADNQKVTTCKGTSISWAQMDVELKGANYPGPFDHANQELSAYNNAACPSGKVASSSAVLGVRIAQNIGGHSVPVASPPNIAITPSTQPIALFPTNFRLANSKDDLNNAQPQPFITNGQVVDWQLTSGNGIKTVYAQFELNGVWGDPVSATVTLNEPVQSSAFQIGVNMETAPSYGYNDLRPFSSKTDVDTDLKEVARMGGTVVRVFAANNKISNQEAAKRLGDFLTAAQSYNISVIVSLIDFYGSGHNPQGTDSFYTGNFNGISLLNHDFFASGYKQDYKNFVTTVVTANKNHPNIYAWEPGNELKDDSSPQTFIDFMKDITSTIKGIDPTHAVATGMIRAGHTGLSPLQLYSNLPNVDIITVHPYDNSHDGSDDVAWAVQNGKKAIVEETGISGTGDRTDQMKQTISYWQGQGASALLQWGFMAKGISDNGDGDKNYGMDDNWHSADYEKLVDLFLSTTSIANTTPQSCAQCVLNQNSQITSDLQNEGFSTIQANIDNMVTTWCGNNQLACSAVRNGACNSACQIPVESQIGTKIDQSLQQIKDATNSAAFIKDNDLQISTKSVPVKIVTLNQNFKLPQDVGTQGTKDGNVTDASIDINKLSEITSDNSVIHVQFDGPTVKVSNGQGSSSSFNQTTTSSNVTTQTIGNGSTSTTDNNQIPVAIATPNPTPQPSTPPTNQPSQNKYDLNNDGKVNSADVAIFFKDWLSGSDSSKIDFNDDGSVNAVDFGILVKNLSL